MGDHRLDSAMQEQDWDMALYLIKHKQGLRHTDTGWSVLHTAVWKNAPASVCEALVQHIDPNRPDDLGDTPVHYAIRFNVSRSLLLALLRAGGDPNRRNLAGRTPLILGTTMSCSLELILILLGFGASLQTVDYTRLSAIDWAYQRGNNMALREFDRVRSIILLAASCMFRRRCAISQLPLDLVRKLNTML